MFALQEKYDIVGYCAEQVKISFLISMMRISHDHDDVKLKDVKKVNFILIRTG